MTRCTLESGHVGPVVEVKVIATRLVEADGRRWYYVTTQCANCRCLDYRYELRGAARKSRPEVYRRMLDAYRRACLRRRERREAG